MDGSEQKAVQGLLTAIKNKICAKKIFLIVLLQFGVFINPLEIDGDIEYDFFLILVNWHKNKKCFFVKKIIKSKAWVENIRQIFRSDGHSILNNKNRNQGWDSSSSTKCLYYLRKIVEC